MKAYDTIKKEELEVTTAGLIELMQNNRQVDLVLHGPKTDEDGYLTWDTEYWSTVDNKRFIRTYSLDGRTLRDSTAHNIYDLENEFHPVRSRRSTKTSIPLSRMRCTHPQATASFPISSVVNKPQYFVLLSPCIVSFIAETSFQS